jgi:hypothetical protein
VVCWAVVVLGVVNVGETVVAGPIHLEDVVAKVEEVVGGGGGGNGVRIPPQ